MGDGCLLRPCYVPIKARWVYLPPPPGIPHVTHWHHKQGRHPHRPFSMKASRVLLWKLQSTACGNWERVARSAESKVGPTDPHLLVSFWDPLWNTNMHPHPTRGWPPHQHFQWKSAGFLLPLSSFTVTCLPPWFWLGPPPPRNKILRQNKYYHFTEIITRTRA